MEPPIVRLIRSGEVHETLQILVDEVPNRKIFLERTGSHLQQFVGLAARNGSIEILRRCIRYGVKLKMGSSFGLHAIVGAASRGHDHVIQWLLEPWVESGRIIGETPYYNKLTLPQGWLYPALHKAIQGQHVSTVKLLVEEAWADVNACDNDNLRPLHVAADHIDKDNPEQMTRYEKIVDILVTAGALVNDFRPITHTTPLYDAVSLNSREATKKLIDGGAEVRLPFTENNITVLHIAAAAGFQETLRTILEHDQLRQIDAADFDAKDKDGRTPLHAAIYGGNLECVRILVKKGLSLTSTCGTDVTAIKAIFEQIPNPVALLTEILDEQVTASDKSGNKVIIDFSLIMSKHSDAGDEDRIPDLDVIVALVNSAPNMEQMSILQHPVLETFLHLKYLAAMQYDLLVLFFHLLFAGLLWWQVQNLDSIEKEWNGFKHLVILSLAFAIGFENMARLLGRRIVENLDKLDRFLLLASGCVSFFIVYFEGMVVEQSLKAHPDFHQSPRAVYLSGIAVLCSWTNVMLVLNRFPFIGEYSFMFLAILTKVAKVLFSFACLIIGFALSLSVLFSNNNQFDTPWKALAKTLVMMTGEYEHDALFPSTNHDNSTLNCRLQVPCIVIFLIFVTVISSIAFMNLTVGLAVNDIQGLLKESRTRRLVKQANSAAVLSRFSYFTKSIYPRIKVNLNNSSRIPYCRISADVKKALYELALKNLHRNEPRSQPGSSCDNGEDSLREIKSLQQEMAKEIQRLVAQMKLMVEDTKDIERQPKNVSPNYPLAPQNVFNPHSQDRNDILAIDYKIK